MPALMNWMDLMVGCAMLLFCDGEIFRSGIRVSGLFNFGRFCGHHFKKSFWFVSSLLFLVRTGKGEAEAVVVVRARRRTEAPESHTAVRGIVVPTAPTTNAVRA